MKSAACPTSATAITMSLTVGAKRSAASAQADRTSDTTTTVNTGAPMAQAIITSTGACTQETAVKSRATRATEASRLVVSKLMPSLRKARAAGDRPAPARRPPSTTG
ncbi:MAG: hypothetical protein MUC89_24275, partial [Acetobacteraceae bacterium]|nr:hypothetical protein [Acetobacteraceae bacterium]